MIFVTVGTHEQQFDRLIKHIDELKGAGIITEEVIIQTGFSNYEPVYCQWSKLFSYREMQKQIEEARIVITHGGPSSFISPLQIGKIPIVVPRQKKYEEHVNNHQVDFCREIENRLGNIIVVEDIEKLQTLIADYDQIVTNMTMEQRGNNKKFNEDFQSLVEELFR